MQDQLTRIMFPCQTCDSHMLFDVESEQMKCMRCGRKERMAFPTERPMKRPLDLSSPLADHFVPWSSPQQNITCQHCNHDTLLPAYQISYICGFCSCPNILVQTVAGEILPESVIPFRTTRDQVIQSFALWRKQRWFVPNSFKHHHIVSEVHAVYIPHWLYDAATCSSYTAEAGTNYTRRHQRTQTVNGVEKTYEETEDYTEWCSVSGTYEQFFEDILVSASSQYNRTLLANLSDFHLENLVPYRSEFISGFAAEQPTISLKMGWDETQSIIKDKLESAVTEQIDSDEVRNISLETSYTDMTYKHMLLPVWNAAYTYRNKPYHYMVNGETGTISGTVPRSPWKIIFFILCCVAIITVVGYLIYIS